MLDCSNYECCPSRRYSHTKGSIAEIESFTEHNEETKRELMVRCGSGGILGQIICTLVTKK